MPCCLFLNPGRGNIDAAGTPDGALDHSVQLVSGTRHSLVQIVFVVGDSHGWTALQAGLKHAALVALAALMAIFFTEVNFNACDLVNMPTQSGFNFAACPGHQRFVAVDVMIGMNLNLHLVSLCDG